MQLYPPHKLTRVGTRRDTIRVVFCHRNFAKISKVSHRGLGVSQMMTAATLRQSGYWAKALDIDRAADLPQTIARWRPTHVVIAAPWIETDALAELCSEHHDTQFAVVCHSNVGFLSVDPGAVARLRELADLSATAHNFTLAVNSARCAEWAQAVYGRGALLPNLYDCQSIRKPVHAPPHDTIDVAIPGAMRPLKNMFTAAAACLEIAERLRRPLAIHVTTGRDNGAVAGNIAKLMGHRCRLVEHRWLSWTDFRRMLARTQLVLQPSYTESFNIVVADAVAEGVPSVVSTAIEWLPRRWQADADSAHEIAAAGLNLLHDPSAIDEGQEALRDYVWAGLRKWVDYLER